MGTCCYGNKPSEKFIGTWTDNQYTELTIHENGSINYQRNTEHSRTSFNGPTRFDNDKYFFCCCCCYLRGDYTDQDGEDSKLTANGVELIRK